MGMCFLFFCFHLRVESLESYDRSVLNFGKLPNYFTKLLYHFAFSLVVYKKFCFFISLTTLGSWAVFLISATLGGAQGKPSCEPKLAAAHARPGATW